MTITWIKFQSFWFGGEGGLTSVLLGFLRWGKGRWEKTFLKQEGTPDQYYSVSGRRSISPRTEQISLERPCHRKEQPATSLLLPKWRHAVALHQSGKARLGNHGTEFSAASHSRIYFSLKARLLLVELGSWVGLSCTQDGFGLMMPPCESLPLWELWQGHRNLVKASALMSLAKKQVIMMAINIMKERGGV